MGFPNPSLTHLKSESFPWKNQHLWQLQTNSQLSQLREQPLRRRLLWPAQAAVIWPAQAAVKVSSRLWCPAGVVMNFLPLMTRAISRSTTVLRNCLVSDLGQNLPWFSRNPWECWMVLLSGLLDQSDSLPGWPTVHTFSPNSGVFNGEFLLIVSHV